MLVRCKFVCHYKDKASGQVSFSPVYSGSAENKAFFAATPGGQVNFYCVAESAFESFEIGKEYYLDFTMAPDQTSKSV